MSTIITAVYERGVLRPLMPLTLPEHAQVRVQIMTSSSDEKRQEWERLTQACRKAGLVSPINNIGAPSVSTERREELMRLAADEKPLSEIVIEDREDRV